MSWICSKKYLKNIPDLNQKFLDTLKGELEEKQAKITLAEFLRVNVGFTVELLTGGDTKLAQYEEILLKGVLNKNFSMFVMGRGLGKSYLAGHLCYLIPLFEPGTNIIVAAPTFRSARNIFKYSEAIKNSKNAVLLRQIFGQPSYRNDLWEYPVLGDTCVSHIRALPLNNKIRGFRANTLILDEFMLLSEEIIRTVLMPFLVAPTDIKERIEIREFEDKMIKEGKMKEEERLVFPNKSRMIALSSASFTFENLYKVYSEWMDNIMNEAKPVEDATYFIAQMGFRAVPEYMVDKTIIEEAMAGGEENAAFQREYSARFVDGSDSFFSAKRMMEQTIKDGERPTTKIIGEKNKSYILSIDPSWSQATNSDHFAMSLLEINENDSITLVHNYAVAGGQLNDHIRYFLYLLLSFNIILIISDSADGNFLQAANESEIFKNKNIKLGIIDYDGSLEGEDYSKMLKEIRRQYNLDAKKICFKHIFNSNSIRRINEQLQKFIDTKKIWFASKLCAHEEEYEKAICLNLPYEFKKGEDIGDFISNQDDLIFLTKKECALIEPKVNPLGTMVFDLPQILKRNNSSIRVRRDSYTSLMLGIEGFRAYTDIMRQDAAPKSSLFIPQMYGKSTM